MRRCFFIFDYESDLDEVRRVAELGLVQAQTAAGLDDLTLWSAAKAKGVEEVKRLIDEGLSGTTCSVVFIGPRTASLGYATYAIERSIHRQNGLFGVHIHGLRNPLAGPGERAPVPYEKEAREQTEGRGYPVYDWDADRFVDWVNAAATDWRNYARPTPPVIAGAR